MTAPLPPLNGWWFSRDSAYTHRLHVDPSGVPTSLTPLCGRRSSRWQRAETVDQRAFPPCPRCWMTNAEEVAE